MKSILFLYRKTAKNRIKTAIKRPVTYLVLLIVYVYMQMIFGNFGQMAEMIGIDTTQGFVIIATVGSFFFIPGNLISYCKKKGLLFRAADVHFLFPSPIGPKTILMAAHVKNLAVYLIVQSILSIGGVLWFGIPAWKMVLYFILSCIIENVLESAMMLILYGSERLTTGHIALIRWVMYGIIGSFVVIAGVLYLTEGMSMNAVTGFLNSEALIMVPIVGWYIGTVRLLLIGATALNVAAFVLYAVFTLLLLIFAIKMKCHGAYFEDAIKFADDYEEARAKNKKGEMAMMGKKAKYKSASVVYKGHFAKAIFYRQLLEYKKHKFFIFGPYTLLCLALGIGIAVFAVLQKVEGNGEYMILGVMAYLTFVFSSYLGKWGKELEKPYTYLIPDTPMRKLWYSTAIEHIRSLVDGLILTLPGGIIMGLSVIQMLLIVIIYVCLQACKLYCGVMVEALLGNVLGSTAKQFARIFFEGFIIVIGIFGAVLGTALISQEAGFMILIVLSVLLTFATMAVAAINFKRMETA